MSLLRLPVARHRRFPLTRRAMRAGMRALAAVVLLAGCAGGDGLGPAGRPSDLVVSANLTGTTIRTLSVTISAADLPRPLVFNIQAVLGPNGEATGVATGTLTVPSGRARLIVVRGFDVTGSITYEGSTTVDVRSGINPGVSIVLLPVMGSVPITVTVATLRIVLSPTAATLAPGGTAQLTATVTDGDGVPFTRVPPTWSSANPAVATVSSTGLVTAVAPGTVTVSARLGGALAEAVITVTGPTTANRLRIFRDGVELTGFIRNDTLELASTATYGPQRVRVDYALADANGQRLRPTTVSAASYLAPAPQEAWLTPAPADTGVGLQIEHTPTLLAAVHEATVTVTATGFTPLVLRYRYALAPRLVFLRDRFDSTSVITGLDLPLDRNVGQFNVFARQIGGACLRGTFALSDGGTGALPAWLLPSTVESPTTSPVATSLFDVGVADLAPGATGRVALEYRLAVPAEQVGDARCPVPPAPATIDVAVRAPAFRMQAAPRTLMLTPDSSTGPLFFAGEYDLSVGPRAPLNGSCPAFQLGEVARSLIVSQAESDAGLDGTYFGNQPSPRPVGPATPTGARIRIELNDAPELHRNRTFRFGYVLTGQFRCPDGVIPAPDTLWVEFTTPTAVP